MDSKELISFWQNIQSMRPAFFDIQKTFPGTVDQVEYMAETAIHEIASKCEFIAHVHMDDDSYLLDTKSRQVFFHAGKVNYETAPWDISKQQILKRRKELRKKFNGPDIDLFLMFERDYWRKVVFRFTTEQYSKDSNSWYIRWSRMPRCKTGYKIFYRTRTGKLQSPLFPTAQWRVIRKGLLLTDRKKLNYDLNASCAPGINFWRSKKVAIRQIQFASPGSVIYKVRVEGNLVIPAYASKGRICFRDKARTDKLRILERIGTMRDGKFVEHK
jgi:hypothetical protein